MAWGWLEIQLIGLMIEYGLWAAEKINLLVCISAGFFRFLHKPVNRFEKPAVNRLTVFNYTVVNSAWKKLYRTGY